MKNCIIAIAFFITPNFLLSQNCQPAGVPPVTATFTTSGQADGGVGDAGNFTGTLCSPSGTISTVAGISWSNITGTLDGSGNGSARNCSNLHINISGPSDGISLNPWATSSDIGTCSAASSGIQELDDVMLEFDTDASGCVTIEFFVDSGGVPPSNAGDFTGGSFTLYFCPQGSVLPISLGRFWVQSYNDMHFLQWETFEETNSDFFGVERSFDGNHFEEIGIVQAAGQSNTLNEYSYLDKNVHFPGTYYYRLRMEDIDGHFEYSPIIAIESGKVVGFEIFPNPVRNRLSIKLTDQDQELPLEYIIYSTNGSVVLKGDVTNPDLSIDLQNLHSGIYTIFVKGMAHKKFIVD